MVQALPATVLTLILGVIIIMDLHGWSFCGDPLDRSDILICDDIPIGATPGQLSRYGIMCLSRRASTSSSPGFRPPDCVIDAHTGDAIGLGWYQWKNPGRWYETHCYRSPPRYSPRETEEEPAIDITIPPRREREVCVVGFGVFPGRRGSQDRKSVTW